ncbi:hypothetical protein IQ264_03150 [Phormidium sp. LEGE 05292]|uniref:hypothetical protein n=1 Tax=[Phormidium] sp. LEGE 05292 TaxID=767427 RepID=UPI00188099F5|nr:hypothetical protein [Phormidium sp. LEGE 05292]MBE9224472.1 hypothetical protein [Phormidium sp. LEGE 05292]
MKLKTLVIITLATPLWLSTPLRAESLVQFKQPILVTQKASWNEFSSEPGRFAVSMPGTPQEETETNEDGSTEHSFSLTSDDSAFLIHYSDIPDIEKLSKEQITELLDNAPNDFAKAAKAKLITATTVSLDGHPGKEFEFTSSEGINGKGRVYLVKQRLYIVVGMTTQPDNLQRFLDSFRLI